MSPDNENERMEWTIQDGEQLKAARLNKEMTQADLASKLEVTQGTISNWERGKGGPGEEQREQLEKILGPLSATDSQERSDLALWLRKKVEEMQKEKTIQVIAAECGVSVPTLYNIMNDIVKVPQNSTIEKLNRYFGKMPSEVSDEAETRSTIRGLGTYSEFDPFDREEWPTTPGVYILYDISGRPVYVGKSRNSIAQRLQDHHTRFWYKSPVVKLGAYIHINDRDMITAVEALLIKALRSMAIMNTSQTIREEGTEE